MYANIPGELRQLNQWVTWRMEDHGGAKPTKVPYNPTNGHKASHSDPFSWTTYDTALTATRNGLYDGIGFVLAESDPYAFIDLDDVHDDAEAMERQLRIFKAFDSYSEVSPSGKGLHIIVKGAVPAGRKRSYVEVYSNVRFMTMTGNVYHAAPINERQALLAALWEQMGGDAIVSTYEGDATEKESDQTVLDRAAAADNGEKFKHLWFGQWQQHYSSQSEADFALINILAFYTKHKGQIIRLFRLSALGQRPKALRSKYVDYMVARSFDRMLPPIDIEGLKIQMEKHLAERKAASPANPFTQVNYVETFSTNTGPLGDIAPNTTEYPTVAGVQLAKRPIPFARFQYEKPPGLVGDIANFILAAAPRPVPEIALVAALALMSGICGRAYNVSGMGLNQYILLLAGTGVGKEGIASGIDRLMTTIRTTVPASQQFIGPAEIASPEALLKYMNSTSCSFVSIFGEFALKMKQMSQLNAAPQHAGLKRIFLDLFNKSGEGKLLHPIIYSDKQKNTDIIEAPAFSMMGESVPERFYETLNEGMISEGLLPRFTIIEYRGDRPPLNENHGNVQPSMQLIEQLSGLCGHSLTLNQANRAIHVRQDEQAAMMFRKFDVYCDDCINKGAKEVVRQLWNRAHVKALKLAALVSVGNNPFDPVINEQAADWAIKIVVHDTTMLLERFESGKVGAAETSDTAQIDDVSAAIMQYLTEPYATLDKYHVQPVLHAAKVVPYSYLSRRMVNMTSFRNDRMGATNALKKCIQALVDRGELQEISPSDRAARFKTTAKCYAIPNIRAFQS